MHREERGPRTREQEIADAVAAMRCAREVSDEQLLRVVRQLRRDDDEGPGERR